MTGAMISQQLERQGFDPLALEDAARLAADVLSAFAASAATGGDPEQVWWVPGRLEVLGKHTDYAGGRSLVAAVPRGFLVAARRRADRRVHLVDARRGDVMALEIDAPRVTLRGWRHYVEVVVRRLARNFPGAALGADIAFGSNLPTAAGLSSSSALLVGIASALAWVGGLADRPEWTANLRSPLDRAGYFACLENGLTFGSLAGDAGVGTHGGSEDHAAIVCGKAGLLSEYAFVPPRHVGDVELPAEWRFVIATSGVAAEKTGAALASYNRLSHGVQVLLDLWNTVHERRTSLADALRSSPDALERLSALVSKTRGDGWDSESLQRRLTHFVREDGRVPEAARGFEEGNAERLAAITLASQQDAESLLGNQIAETIALASSARQLGAIGACSFGAGFGGSVWALVPHDRSSAFARDWIAAYRTRCAAAANAVTFTAIPSLPLTTFL